MRKTYECKCVTCGDHFQSLTIRSYCSRACYIASPQFREHIGKNMAAGRAKGHGPERQGDMRICQCGAEFYARKSSPRKFCTRACHREFMAARFDRFIAQPCTFTELHGYDEFLTQPVLPCLVSGCEWSGHHLSLHMNQAHGVVARQFKQIAGFNITSGIISPSMRKNLEGREHISAAKITKRGGFKPGAPRSRESVEHFEKAMELRALTR